MEKRGIETKKGDYNRKVQHENALIEIFSAEYAPAFEPEGETLVTETGQQKTDDRNRDLGQGGATFPTADFNFSDAGAMTRLEAMTLELKDEHADHSNADSEAGTKPGDKEAIMGAFKNDEADPEKLALASLEASQAIHEAALRAYLQSTGYQSAQEQVILNTRLKDYARRGMEKIKGLGEKVYRQFSNLIQETGRLRERDRDDHER